MPPPPSVPNTQVVLDALASIQARPVTPEEEQEQLGELPVPMLEGNWKSASDSCLVGEKLTDAVVEASGWEYLDESRTHNARKLGYIANASGSVLKVRINTAAGQQQPSGGSSGGGMQVRLGRWLADCPPADLTASPRKLEELKETDASSLVAPPFS